jgi:hypothetical protein
VVFTIRNKSLIKDTILGEGVFKFETMGDDVEWEGDVTLHGYNIKSLSSALHIKIERKNCMFL